METKKTKIVFEEHIVCPHCDKGIIVKHTKRQTTEPIQAEYEEETIVEKDEQTTLSEKVEPL